MLKDIIHVNHEDLRRRLRKHLLKVWFAYWQTANAKLTLGYDQYLRVVKDWKSDIFWGLMWSILAVACAVVIVLHIQYVVPVNINMVIIVGIFTITLSCISLGLFIKVWVNSPPKVVRKLARDYYRIHKLINDSDLPTYIENYDGDIGLIINDMEEEEEKAEGESRVEFDQRLKDSACNCLQNMGDIVATLEGAPTFNRQQARKQKREKFIPLYKAALALRLIEDLGYGKFIPKPAL